MRQRHDWLAQGAFEDAPCRRLQHSADTWPVLKPETSG
jgi:hypothetical protein